MESSITGNSRQVPAAPARVSDKGALHGSIGLSIITLAGFGFLYSLAGVGLGQAFFRDAANGSLIKRDGRVIGSALVAQPFVGDGYFRPRPSAAGYDPMALAGSNQARTNPDLRKRLEDTREAIARHEGVDPADVPGDLFTQSGSGIDPHITPRAAAIQVDRIARARGIGRDVVAGLVARHTQEKQWGMLGQARVNVLELNLALDALAPPRPARTGCRGRHDEPSGKPLENTCENRARWCDFGAGPPWELN